MACNCTSRLFRKLQLVLYLVFRNWVLNSSIKDFRHTKINNGQF